MTFHYRIVLQDGNFDAANALAESNLFATPAYLQTPDQPPVLPGLDALKIGFPGGPLLAFKWLKTTGG